MEISRILLVVLALGILFGCTDQAAETNQTIAEPEEPKEAAEPPEVEETTFKKFTDDDFSFEYPDWEEREGSNTSIISVGNALCVLNVDRHETPITPLFNWMVNFTAANENVSLDEVDIENHEIGFVADFDNITFKAVTNMEYCNHKTYIILATCAKDYWNQYEEEVDRFTSSVKCAKEYAEPDYSAAPSLPDLEDTRYGIFIDDDYSAKIPEWNQGEAEKETIISLSEGACTVILNRYNAPADTLYDWTEKYIEENGSLELDSKSPSKHEISYQLHAEDVTLHIESKITYCNYQSYNMIALCEEQYFEDNVDVLEYILDSPKCAKEYSIAPEIVELEEVDEIPEEERIVETDVGEEYGINAEAVVSFFNSNPIFVKVMKKYDRVNLRITGDEDIKLKAKLEDGYIVNVAEGAYSDADFTLTMPLEDALNIFNNADNITIGNILSFIINVKTDPPEKMNELIKEAFAA